MLILNDKPLEYNFAGTRVRLLMSGRDTNSAFCMMEMFSPPGKSTPLHLHEREDETVTVLEGVVNLIVGDRVVQLRAGETALLPRHIAHRISTSSDTAARYLVVCAPAGFDDFVDACADAQREPVIPTPPGPADIARMRAAAPHYGIKLLPS
jgi:quercetin dioxygenase-like cupin family protein